MQETIQMSVQRRLYILAAATLLLALGVWTYLQIGQDKRMAQIGLSYAGADGEFAQTAAELPMSGSYDLGLGFFDISLKARSNGLVVALKKSDHSLAHKGDLTFVDGKTEVMVMIDGTGAELSVFDTSATAKDGATGPKFLGNLKVEARFILPN